MILNRQRSVRIAIRPLEVFLQRVQNELGVAQADVTVALISDAEIARMNQAYREKIGPTDVLSFPAVTPRRKGICHRDMEGTEGRKKGKRKKRANPRDRSELYLGDIAVAPAMARRNARRLGRSLPSELRILILHGVLHLLGHDHETDRGQMQRLERRLRKRLGLS